jgi:hypothetical protein
MTDSPFLPNSDVQFAWDSTSLGNFKLCPRYYHYNREGWVGRDENIHFRFGQEYHTARQNYDLSVATGLSHDDAMHDVVRELMHAIADYPDFDPEEAKGSAKYKTKESLVRTVIWGLERDRHNAVKTFIKSDGKPMVEQSFRFELDWGPVTGAGQPYILCGHLDKVGTFVDELYVVDYKTSTFKPENWFFGKFDPHNQMTLYTLAAKVVLGVAVKGVILEAVQILGDKSIFGRGMTFRSQDQLDEWVDDLHYWFTLAEQCAISDRWPLNDTACDMYGGCKFRDVCSKSPTVRERFLEGGFVQRPKEERWNPLRSR